MALEAGLDTGPVYRRVVTPIDDREPVTDLRDRLVAIGTTMLVEALAAGPLDPKLAIPQRGDVTYAAKLDPAEFVIDWERPAVSIIRQIRLGTAWTLFRGRRLKVLDAIAEPRDARATLTSENSQGQSPAETSGDGIEAGEVN